MSVVYYTTPLHATAVASSVSSNTATMGNALDGKLNTYWNPSINDLAPGGTWNYAIDTYPQDEDEYLAGRGMPSGSIDAIGIFMGNTEYDFTGANIGVLEGSSSVSITDIVGSYIALTDLDGPMYVRVLNQGPSTKRFIKIEGTAFAYGGLNSLPEMNFFLLSTNTLTRQHEYNGSSKLPMYNNDVIKLSGTNDHVTAHQKEPVDVYKRMYKLINATEVSWVETVYNESKGRRNQFIINESSGQVNNVLCRFDRDKPKWKDITGDYREATLEFQSIHYVRDGQTI